MFNVKKNKKGFTLVELMVVVVIIGILTAIAIPVYNSVTANAQEKTCKANQRIVKEAATLYAADNDGSYPVIADMTSTILDQYIEGGLASIVCPSGGTYTISGTATTPLAISCSVSEHN